MSDDISFVRIETEISDYKTSSKKKEQDMFGKLIKKLSVDKMEIELLTDKGIINCTSKISGSDKLDITTVLNDENQTIMSVSRALDKNYKELVSKRTISENGVYIDGIQVELEDRTLSLKIVKQEKSDEVLAVVKEQHFPITEVEYLKQMKNFGA